MTKEEFDNKLVYCYETLNRKFTMQEFKNLTGTSATLSQRYYGSWWKALETLGLEKKAPKPKNKKSKPTKAQIISAMQKFTKDTINPKALQEQEGISLYYVNRIFGSWNNALKEAGFPANYITNKEEAIEILTNVYKTLGGVPSRRALVQNSNISDKAIDRLFGTYTAMLIEAELDTMPQIYGYQTEGEKRRRRVKKLKDRQKRNIEFLEKYGYARPVGSHTQEKLTSYIAQVLNTETLIKEHTWSWLINPETQANLRVDAYFPEYNLAFEYQSEIHFEEMDWTKHDLKDVLKRDYLKKQLLQQNDVLLFELSYFEPHTLEYIKDKLTKVIKWI